MYWFPNVHEPPTGSKLIITTAKCFTKPVPNTLTSIAWDYSLRKWKLIDTLKLPINALFSLLGKPFGYF